MICKIVCRRPLVPALLLLPFFSLPAAANNSGNQCVDPDGDGWGWDGYQSCRVEAPSTHVCVDTDGDGWGWDGTQSCRAGAPVVRQCVDTDLSLIHI